MLFQTLSRSEYINEDPNEQGLASISILGVFLHESLPMLMLQLDEAAIPELFERISLTPSTDS